MITVSDPKRSRILAADATGLKQHNRGEWMGKKWRVKRGFVKRHVMVDTQTMKIVALSVTDESVADVTEFHPLLGQCMDAVGTKGGAGGAPGHSEDPGPDAPARERGDVAPPCHPVYQNRLASGSRPSPRPRRTAPMTRQRPISYMAMPHTARGTTWPRARVQVSFRASCTGST